MSGYIRFISFILQRIEKTENSEINSRNIRADLLILFQAK